MLFLKSYPLKNGRPQLRLWNKETLYPEKFFSLRLTAVNFKKNCFLGTTTLDRTHFLFAAISLGFLYIFQYL